MLVKKLEGKNTGKIYAMKILKKAHIIKNDQVENTKAEQHILKEINHPFIVRLRYAFQNDDKLYLVMDYYQGGSLFYHLRKSKRFTEERTKLYMAQLLTAIMHLHSKQIAYRDLKLENILMDENGNIALTDFGLSKEGQEVQGAVSASEEGMKTICGTAEYMVRVQSCDDILDNTRHPNCYAISGTARWSTGGRTVSCCTKCLPGGRPLWIGTDARCSRTLCRWRWSFLPTFLPKHAL